MNRFFRAFQNNFYRNPVVFYLSVFWVLGLFSGAFFAAVSDNSYFLLMRAAAYSRVSVLGLILYAYLPFLFVAFASCTGRGWLLLLVCFLKALLFSWSFIGIYAAFGSAGWLARLLLQFSDLFLVPLLYWFSLRSVSCLANTRTKDLTICTFFFIIFGCVDYCVVSPFLTMLIDI